MWFYDEGWDEVLAFRKEAGPLKKEHPVPLEVLPWTDPHG